MCAVSFPQPRLALLTASVGSLGGSTVTPLCVQTTNLTLTCDLLNGAAATSEVRLRVTSATGSTSPFLQANATLRVSSACGQCASLAGGSSPAPSPAVSSPSPAPVPSPAVTVVTASQCGASSLGYACALTLAGGSGETLHWTAGTAAPPDNACTRVHAVTAPASSSGPADLVHFALTSPQSGFVSMGFTQRPGMMSPSNVVLGRIMSDVASVATYQLSSYSLGAPTTNADWVTGAAVLSTSDGGRVLCFSVAADGAAAAATAAAAGHRRLTAAAAATTGAAHRRSLAATTTTATAATASSPSKALGLSAAGLQIIWSSSASPDRKHNRRGGVFLNVLSGAADASDASKRRNQMLALHGALATAGWVLLVPLGLLLARHRRTIGLLRSAPQLGGLDQWFVLHLSCVVTGVCCGAAAIGVAVQELRGSGMSDATATAHRAIGWTVLGVAVLQLMAGAVRPQPDAPSRRVWYLVHSNIGRLATMLAWAGTGIGVFMATTRYGQDMTAWVAPLVATLGLMLGAELGLELSAAAVDGKAGGAAYALPLPPVAEVPEKGQQGTHSSPGRWMPGFSNRSLGVARKLSSGGGGLASQSSVVTSQSSTGFDDSSKEPITKIDMTTPPASARG
ncbi:hypothetical protein HXX76_005652 [Chlamydomonas incerta]|uniref:Cytochrome b561 domain-containing protein n=1 Tax=Chlamydomonas incerta TaxID=51695 RepID=A0A835T3C5_CHLIN|nr:hypothetical protein HXX76_005652 [Chlamydomonas incerta]|eukprot:KAG2438038.1 hypothetical protein HXX76_005652 [Chlamydomonas incerta]